MKARAFLPLVVAVVLLALAGAAAQAAPLAPPLPSPPYIGPGPYCLADTGVSPLNCTANDTRISQLTPNIEDVCLSNVDYATVDFHADLVIGATTRWDIAMYVASEGGSAVNGGSCYKDVLQPVADLNAPGDPLNPAGTGPFKNQDDDSCGEGNQTVGAHYQLQTMTIKCADANGDSVVDPINTCTSWSENADTFSCFGVSATMPGPGAPSKCECEAVPPNILIYRGYDWGDLPNSYGTLTGSNGARHAIQDTNNDNTPDTITDLNNPAAVVPAVWLGPTVDYSPNAETDGQPNVAATGDDTNIQNGNLVDDENGVTPVGLWFVGTNGGQVSVTVSSSNGTCTGCRLGFWFDWNNSGAFGAGEAYERPVNVGSQTLTFDIPSGAVLSNIYARFRLYDGIYVGTPSPAGLVVNGEVEDYRLAVPTAVEVLSFTATGGKAIVLKWETASEVDNLGFNLYTAVQIDGPRTKLNEDLIPSLVAPGSPFGANYTYTDPDLKLPGTYYYWLEDVDIYGMTGLHGPVEVTVGKWQRAGWPLAD